MQKSLPNLPLQETAENRLNSLRDLIKDVERYRQRALAPIATNVKNVRSVIGSQLRGEPGNDFNNFNKKCQKRKANSDEGLRENCDKYYRMLRHIVRQSKSGDPQLHKDNVFHFEKIAESCKKLRNHWHIQEKREAKPKLQSTNMGLKKSPVYRSNLLSKFYPNNMKLEDVINASGNIVSQEKTNIASENEYGITLEKFEKSHSSNNSNNFQRNRKYFLQEIRSAIHEGRSQDPLTNKNLAAAIKEALAENIPWSLVENAINETNQMQVGEPTLHLLQMQIGSSVYVMCTIRTLNFPRLLSNLDPLMQKCEVQFVPVLQHFTHCCCIEALLPETVKYRDLTKIQKHLKTDALLFRVNHVAILNELEKKVCIKCDPNAKDWTLQAMENRGYSVLSTVAGLRPRKYISLGPKSARNYRYFLNQLSQMPDVESVCDNVI